MKLNLTPLKQTPDVSPPGGSDASRGRSTARQKKIKKFNRFIFYFIYLTFVVKRSVGRKPSLTRTVNRTWSESELIPTHTGALLQTWRTILIQHTHTHTHTHTQSQKVSLDPTISPVL